jgi:stage III sporulation protein AB
MLKTFALSLLFLACGGTGALLAHAAYVRTRELELCLQMVAAMRAKLQFSRPPLERMLEELCAQSRSPTFLSHCLAEMRTGIVFPLAWRSALLCHGGGLKEADRQQLLSLGELLGGGSAESQRETLQMQESLLESQLEQARAQRDTKGKAFFMLGILGGLTMLILFL